MNSGAASPRSRRALRPVHWRWRIAIAGKRCEISKALRQRSSAIRFLACQRSIGENANGLTDESRLASLTRVVEVIFDFTLPPTGDASPAMLARADLAP